MKTVKAVCNAHFLLGVFFVCSFVVGNRAALGKFIGRPGSTDLFAAFARLARAVAGGIVLTNGSHSDDLSLWCALQASAAVARAAHCYSFQRVPWQSILQEDVTGAAEIVKGALIMEAVLALSLLPCVFRRRRLFPIFFGLCLPSIACLLEGSQQKSLEFLLPVPEMVPKLAMVFAAMSLVSLFLSGVSGILCGGAIVQLLVVVHGLDTIKI